MASRLLFLLLPFITITIINHPTTAKATTAAAATTMNNLLKEIMDELNTGGYTVAAFQIQRNGDRLMRLNNVTIFVVYDADLDGHGKMFELNFRLHIIPNQRITGMDLINLPVDTRFPTMEDGVEIVVTEAGSGGLRTPMTINKVGIIDTNILSNQHIIVHRVADPLKRYPTQV